MSKGDTFALWIQKNGEMLERCGILSAGDEPISDREKRFISLMRDHVESQSYGGVTEKSLDRAFEDLQRLGLVAQPQEPEPEPETQYTLKIHPRGAPTKMLGPFGGPEAQRRAKLAMSDRQTIVEILDGDGYPVDYDLQPIAEAAERPAEALSDTGSYIRSARAEAAEAADPKSPKTFVLKKIDISTVGSRPTPAGFVKVVAGGGYVYQLGKTTSLGQRDVLIAADPNVAKPFNADDARWLVAVLEKQGVDARIAKE